MKILLSLSKKHFDPEKGMILRHSAGVLSELFYEAVKDYGKITYIDSTDRIVDQEFDILIGQPRNFAFLTAFNSFKKTFCFLNIAESNYTKRVLSAEAGVLGCKISDCFAPHPYYFADHYFLIGNDFVKEQYLKAGIHPEKITKLKYSMGIPFKYRETGKKTVYLHLATTLGLRKGLHRAVEQFKKGAIPDSELWCVGRVQRENFWIDYVKDIQKDPRIKVLGWIDNNDPKYLDILYQSDYILYPSLSDGLAGTVVEAFESGCKPIVSEASGFDPKEYEWGKNYNDLFKQNVRQKMEEILIM